ncbi:hypothetical protein DM860_003743 [Cuscuta australis]|uniref:F-box domain-containing protein n=1 Tax=Cuscuta australis TaxID=267555 RepID=A0A328DHK6_9ASTE|nr:hypothetical protein DM860_003743 [Cuscuta australis]
MGGILSSNNQKSPITEPNEASQSEARKRRRISSSLWEDNPRLIPSLPDEISFQILARLPRIFYINAKLVSRGWKSAIMSPELYETRKELGMTEEWLYILTKVTGDMLVWYALDPVSLKWQRLPPVPDFPPKDGSKTGSSGLWLSSMLSPSMRIIDVVRRWLRKKSSPGQIPFCGCAIGAVNGCLYTLGGFHRDSSMRSVWRYDPITNIWDEISPMSIGRAYCKTGVLNGKLYVVGGVTRDRGGLTPLRSAEVYDPQTGIWTEVPNMPFAKAHLLPNAFLADFLKPIATGICSYRGKLYVPQSLYCWPFFVDAGGEVYDPETNSWGDMPSGMGEGWPARQAGTKLSVIVDGELYALDPCGESNSVNLKVYDSQDDVWKEIQGDIPIRDLADSDSPYLLAGFLGKVNVITKDGNQNLVILQADRHNQSVPCSDTFGGSDASIWRVIASKSNGPAELVSCQILDL